MKGYQRDKGARVCGALPPIVRTLTLTISVKATIGVGRVAAGRSYCKENKNRAERPVWRYQVQVSGDGA